MKRLRAHLILLATLALCSILLIVDLPAMLGPPRSGKEILVGTPDNDISRDMVIDSQDDIIVVGMREEESPWGSNFFAVKVSPVGEEIWTKTWNFSAHDMLVSVDVDSEDNIIVAGVSWISLIEIEAVGHILKVDPDGETIWSIEIPHVQYQWTPGYNEAGDFFGVKVDRQTDNIYAIGSLDDGNHTTLITQLNSSGSVVWQTEWSGPSDSAGSRATTFWLGSQMRVLVVGQIYDSSSSWWPSGGSYLVAYDFNGTRLWNQTAGEYWTGLEIGADRFVTVRHTRSEVACYSYDLERFWSFDIEVGDLRRVTVTGFLMNESQNLIGYGTVESLLAGGGVSKRYSPKYQAPQASQTLIFSFSLEGELQWYDFLVNGRMSETCGCQFDSENRLIVAGHTSDWSFESHDFYVLIDFRQTPFPPHYTYLLLGFFPVLNVLAMGLARELEILAGSRQSAYGLPGGQWAYRTVLKRTLQVEAILLVVLFLSLWGVSSGGGPPPLLVYLPEWVFYLNLSLPLGVLTLGIMYFKTHESPESSE